MDIPNAIIQLRGARKQREFAELVGTNENTVSRWERGATEPDEEKRFKLVALALQEHRRDLAIDIAGSAARLILDATQAPYPKANLRVHEAVERAIQKGISPQGILDALAIVESQLPKRRSVVGE